MKKTVSVESFDWDAFLAETRKNLADMVTEEFLVIKQVGKRVKDYEEGGWSHLDLLEELRAKNTKLFVHFAIDNLEDAVVCADGVTRPYVDPAVVSPGDEDAYDEAVEEAMGNTYTSDTAVVGYVVGRDQDQLTIQAGVYYTGASVAPPPSVDVLGKNEEKVFYGDAMERYIDRFIRRRRSGKTQAKKK